MFDTMTITKALGATCGSLLVFMLASWAADGLYSVGGGHHGGDHGEEIAQAYTIDTGAEEAPAEEAAPEVDFATLLASADPAGGERVFRQCAACHKLDGTDGVGPHLNGVVDRAKGTIGGYAYSEALAALTAEAWTAENLNGFIADPRGYMPGTKMAFNGIPNAEDRASLIAYLATTAP
jgi:cytochrome c